MKLEEFYAFGLLLK